MKKTPDSTALVARPAGLFLSACAVLALAACGGGGNVTGNETDNAPVMATLASATTTLHVDVPELPEAVAAQVVQPLFQMAPDLLPSPDDRDAVSNDASARHRPHRHQMTGGIEALSSRRLTVQAIKAARATRDHATPAVATDETVVPMATGSVVSTYSPAQIRAAYGLPALPAAGSTLTPAQAAQLGAGQTIYIVDAMHDPNLAAELAAFNTKFGLPSCTTKAIATTAALPLPAASTTGCELSVVYNTAAGTMTAAAPAFDVGWATEITLDVQWAHATAPLARIVVIEAPDASINSLLGGIKLANAMGPGIVSMSFGGNEGSWTAQVDSAFSGTNMTYLAATGDSGAAVSWPAVSPKVVAVGGTSLTYTGSGVRSEVGWSGTGGGTSLYTPTPSYQTAAVPGLGTVARRTVADVAFNADPATGQYVAVISPGSSTVNWMSAGGTSLATPQWAGLIAVANATRAQAGKTPLGAPHSVFYSQIGAVPGNYAAAFSDVAKGTNGTCTTCTAKAGYDPLSGLGTPNVTSLLSVLSGTTAAATAPVGHAGSHQRQGGAQRYRSPWPSPPPIR